MYGIPYDELGMQQAEAEESASTIEEGHVWRDAYDRWRRKKQGYDPMYCCWEADQAVKRWKSKQKQGAQMNYINFPREYEGWDIDN